MAQNISRDRNLALGTQIGLYGDYDAPSSWGAGYILSAQISKYITVERIGDYDSRYSDVGVLALRQEEIFINGLDNSYLGKTFLLLHRHKAAWDTSDPIVHVYGLPDDFDPSLPLTHENWREKAVWLSAAAVMCVLDESNISEMGKFLLKKYTVL